MAGAAAVLSATLLVSRCGNEQPLLTPIKRASLKTTTPRPAGYPPDWRAELRNAYRLAPDVRFLMAFGEIDRLAGKMPASSGKAAAATFSDGHWVVELGNSKMGTLPELPDFSDFLPLLVAYAKDNLKGGSGSDSNAGKPPGAGQDVFLMPDLVKGIGAAEMSMAKSRSYRDAARCFARLAFQMEDPLELAPLIPARALALFSAARARDAHWGVEEEVLLAHALGYTAHAEKLAATLPADSPIRAYELLDERSLQEMASRSGASEEIRYLAVRRSASHGELAPWKEARERFMAGNDSLSVIATGLEIDFPAQVEASNISDLLTEALPRAAIREMNRLADPTRKDTGPGYGSTTEFDASLAGAIHSTGGPLWDGDAIEAYYQPARFAPLTVERWPPLTIQPSPGMGMRLLELSQPDLARLPDPDGDTTGAPLLMRSMHRQLQMNPPAFAQQYAEIRALVKWLDTRPKGRWQLADFSRYSLQDPRAAEDLFRSLASAVGEKSRKLRADAALYLGDWATLDRLLASPETTAPEAAAILWSWYTSRADFDRLSAEYERVIERFPTDWNATNQYLNLLRDRKEYQKGCDVVERWLARNPDPRTPGRFHAHVRLSFGYILNHEPEKAFKLLEGMHETESFQLTVRKREMANALAALGRLSEAEPMMREVTQTFNGESEALRDLVQVLWREGKDREAVDTLVRKGLAGWEVCEALEKDFSKVFLELPADRLMPAIEVIGKKTELTPHALCVSRGFANAGRYEDAMRIAERLSPPTPERMDQLIVLYGYMKSWKGAEAAAAWLKEKIPPDQRNPLSMKALYTKNDDVLWDVIGTPNPNDHPEWVWLFRAVAFALRGADDDPRRAELLAYYQKDTNEPHYVMGRYLVGIGTEADMFAVAATSSHHSEIAYYLGARAQHEKRYRDACEWYRVAAESGEETSNRSLAMYALSEWAELRQGIWRLEGGGAEKK